MNENELEYSDFLQKLSIQEVLQDAGYQLNKRDGIRYPSYVRIGSDGCRVRGDKFLVTPNGACCFQPPEQKNFNVISFIKEHPPVVQRLQSGDVSRSFGQLGMQPLAECPHGRTQATHL